jgi:hypothetical protein
VEGAKAEVVEQDELGEENVKAEGGDAVVGDPILPNEACAVGECVGPPDEGGVEPAGEEFPASEEGPKEVEPGGKVGGGQDDARAAEFISNNREVEIFGDGVGGEPALRKGGGVQFRKVAREGMGFGLGPKGRELGRDRKLERGRGEPGGEGSQREAAEKLEEGDGQVD